MQETILNKLRQEHRELEALLDEIAHAETMGLRTEIFRRFKEEMIPHLEGEEAVLYSKLDLVEESQHEHHQMKELIQKLNFLDVDEPDWVNGFICLKELCLTHFEHEELHVFAEAKEDFSPEELVQFATDFEEVKHLHAN